jgi:hypothetical protein
MKAFAEIIKAVDLGQCERAEAEAALVISSYLDSSYPFTDPAEPADLHQTLRQAYVSARLADLPLALARENAGIGQDAKLYLVPSVKQLLAPTWAELEQRAAAGATVYVSYCAGTTSRHPGPSYGRLNSMFGVEHQLRAGLPDPIDSDTVTFRFQRDFGSLRSGDTLTFAVAGTEYSRSYLPVHPAGADVLASDDHGRPALLLRQTGDGSLILCTYPIEHMAARTPAVNPEPTGALYDALATHAGVRRPVLTGDPLVAADVLLRADGEAFAWFVSQADEPVTITPVVTAGLQLAALDGTGPLAESVSLAPFGVAVRRLL